MRFTTEGLKKAGMNLHAPFQIDVQLDPDKDVGDSSIQTLEFQQVTRVLPGRRVSGIALCEGRTVFAKIFYGRQARRYWGRELNGAALMASSEAPSPPVIGQGATVDQGGYIALYQALPGAVGLSAADHGEILAAVHCLARLHDANLVQSDPHLDNFIRSEGVVYAVDSDSLRRAQLVRHHLTNLAAMLAQRAPEFDDEIGEIWASYAHERGEYVARMGSTEQVQRLTRRERHLRVRRYLKKTQRECTEFVQRQKFTRDFLCDRQHWPRLQRFMVFPEEFMTSGVPLKLGNSATVVRCVIDGDAYVIKRYNIKDLAHRVKRWIKRRARNAWMNGHRLDFLGIDTAKPVALLEQRWGWFAGVSYLVMPDCGERDLVHTLANAPERLEVLAPKVVALLKKLRQAGLAHGDLKATNFMVNGDDVLLIDYDAVREGDSERDVARFLENWADNPELLATWQHYLESESSETEAPT
ncbi:MAG: phosphotransferase [Pseudomonadales bacterium]|nr:phosphotransferase [Pseudomonadales bacterium]